MQSLPEIKKQGHHIRLERLVSQLLMKFEQKLLVKIRTKAKKIRRKKIGREQSQTFFAT